MRRPGRVEFTFFPPRDVHPPDTVTLILTGSEALSLRYWLGNSEGFGNSPIRSDNLKSIYRDLTDAFHELGGDVMTSRDS